MAIDKDEIVKEAKKIMDLFLDALKDAEDTESGFLVRRDHNIRDDFKDCKDKGFRERFFSNMPSRKGDYLQAEKKRW